MTARGGGHVISVIAAVFPVSVVTGARVPLCCCAALQVIFSEVACEQLRAKCTARLASEQLAADLELYVPPLCSPSKDTPAGDDSIADLNDAVMAWLSDSAASQVLLLHGQSGSGKSLYVCP